MMPSVMLRLKRMLPLLRLRPFDVSTSQGRADERHRLVALSALASALAKVLSVSTALISVPLTLHYLGVERYGMWMTMSSLIAMLGFADLGIGNGVLSAVARAHGHDDRPAIRRYVSSGMFVLSLIALAIVAVFALCYPWVAWHRIFNVSGELARSEAAPALAVFVTCFALAIPTGIVQRVQMGLQMGFMASLWQCVASAVALAGVLLAIHFQAGLPWLVLAFVGTPLLVSLINSVLFFGRLQPDTAPRRASVSRQAMRQIASTGISFPALQIIVAVAFTSDPVIIAQLLGPEAVAQYAVPDRMFSLVTMLVLMVVGPLWPAYGEAVARGDSEWVRATLRKSLMSSLMFAGSASVVLVLLGPWIIRLWVGNAVVVTTLLLVTLGIWKTVESLATAVAVFLNGATILRFQIFTGITTAMASLGLKLLLAPHIGIAGIPLATTAAWLALTGLPMYFYIRRLSPFHSGKVA